ncbi:hypothetical protein [Microbacterium karelineae]|uniref:hypothetical protein n=1 Tax=Microbacterium karelineae TaxID=2654283 RepID=UPI0012EA495A|nr:hypothetical protein [Microbacterium karelineae]
MSIERDQARLWLVGGVAAAIGVLVIGWFAVLSPAWAAIGDATGEIAAVDAQNGAIASRNADLAAAEDEIERHESNRDAALVRIPSAPGTADFGDALEQVADGSGVELTRLSTGDPSPVEDPDGARVTFAIPVSFTVRGGVDRVEALLDELQRNDARAFLATGVDVLPLDGQQDGDLAGEVVASVSGTIWTIPDALPGDDGGEDPADG